MMWRPTPFACSGCGVDLADECIPIEGGGWLCPKCTGAACARCGLMLDSGYLIDADGSRSCSGCLLPDEQVAVGHEGTAPPEVEV